jgi:hypothetical protein
MSQKNINNDPLLGQVIEKHGIPKDQAPKLKTYEVYHMESNDYTSDRYYNGTVEAKNIDQAIEVFKKEYIREEYYDQIRVEETDKDMFDNETALISGGTDYYLDGELLSNEELERLEDEHDSEIGDLLENKDLDFGYLDHFYELIETKENEEEDDD